MKLYDVKKEVVWGETFIEYRYPMVDNFCIGKWQFYGSSMYSNPSNEMLICADCVTDTKRRERNFSELDSSQQQSEMLFPNTSMRSYRVPGVTKHSDFYEWTYGVCKNAETGACWGPNHSYTFDVQRIQVNEGSGVTKYRFTTTKLFQGLPSSVDQLYINVTRERGSTVRYSGIGWKFSRPSFFWPGLFNREDPATMFYVYFECTTGGLNCSVREELKDKPNLSWPSDWYRREWLFPSHMDFYFYRISDIKMPAPKTLEELHEDHIPVASTFVDIYPGGSGSLYTPLSS